MTTSLMARGIRAEDCERFQTGEWRARIFRDMVLRDIQELGRPATVLDIGCGRGFDGDAKLQRSLMAVSATYIGIEPDPAIELGTHFSAVHRSFLETAPIPPASVDVAFAVMVLEHVENPQPFWEKLHEVLRPGGVFWGFTMDARHRFCLASRMADRLKIKDAYLRLLHGRRGEDRYENYAVHYRCNTPAAVHEFARAFRHCDCRSFGRVGQLDFYLPNMMRPLARAMDHWDRWRQGPGSLLVVRVEK